MAIIITLDLSKKKEARLTTRISGRTVEANNIVELRSKLCHLAQTPEGDQPCPAA